MVGELALDGCTRPAKGALSMVVAAAAPQGLKGLFVPSNSVAEAAVVEGIEIIAVSSLAQAAPLFAGEIDIESTSPRLEEWFQSLASYDVDLSDVRGQEKPSARSPSCREDIIC